MVLLDPVWVHGFVLAEFFFIFLFFLRVDFGMFISVHC